MSADNQPRYFLTAKDVAELLSISVATAYKIIRRLNGDLESQGYYVMPGRVSREFFFKRYGGGTTPREP